MNSFFKIIKYTLWVGVFFLTLANCKPKAKTKAPSANKTSAGYLQKNEAKFIEGMGFFSQQKFTEALDRFQQCYEVQEEEGGLNYMIARTYLQLGGNDKALKYAQKAVDTDKMQKEYYLVLAECYQKLKKDKELVDTYLSMLKNTKGAETYLYDLYEIYMYERNYGEALKTMDKIQDFFGPSETLITEKLKLYLKLNRFGEAEGELRQLVNEHPKEEKYRQALIKLYIDHKKNKEAIGLIDSTLAIYPSDPIATMYKYDLYIENGQKEEAEKYLQKIFSNPNISIDTKIEFVLAMFNGIEKDTAKQKNLISYTNEIIRTNPENAKSYALAGDVNSYSGNKKQAIQMYRKSINLDHSKHIVWVQMVLLELQEDLLDSVITHSKRGQVLFPLDSRFPYFAGTALYQQKKYTEAVVFLKQAQALLTSDSDIKDNTRSVLADCYYYLKEYEKSDAIFEELLKENPRNYSAMNNYCYFLSLRKEKLDYAKELGLRVVKAFPEEATYLDTYGWVLYVNKDYKEAEVYLGKAALGSNNGVIFEHYGDVLFQLGMKDRALEYWNKALKTGDAGEFINQKIKDKKIYE